MLKSSVELQKNLISFTWAFEQKYLVVIHGYGYSFFLILESYKKNELLEANQESQEGILRQVIITKII